MNVEKNVSKAFHLDTNAFSCLFQLQEEKISAIQEKLELAEQKLAQYSKMPEMEEQFKQRMEALTQVRRPNQVRRGITITTITRVSFSVFNPLLVRSNSMFTRYVIFLAGKRENSRLLETLTSSRCQSCMSSRFFVSFNYFLSLTAPREIFAK